MLLLSPENMNEREQLHFDGAQILLMFFLIGALAGLIVTVASLGAICIHPASEIVVSDTGSGLRFDLLAGYANLSAEYLPADYTVPDGKLFAVTYLLLDLITDQLPRLLILWLAGKMLNQIGKSHSPFIPEAADYVKWIGRIIMLMGLFRNLLMQAGISVIVYHQISLRNPIDFSWILVGLIVLLVGDIFKRGCVLQKDADEML